MYKHIHSQSHDIVLPHTSCILLNNHTGLSSVLLFSSDMPRLFPPSLLENPEAQAFCLQKQITDVDSLRHHLRESICLGTDTEGCEGIKEGITSVGVAILPSIDCTRTFRHLPFETQELVDRCGIVSYCFYVEGRNRRKPHASFPFEWRQQQQQQQHQSTQSLTGTENNLRNRGLQPS